MIDRRLFRELKNVRLYWLKTTMAAFAIVVFTLLLNRQLASLVVLAIGGLINQSRNIGLGEQAGQVKIPASPALVALSGSAALLLVWISAKSVAIGLADAFARKVGLQVKRLLRERLTGQFIALGPVHLKSERIAVLATIFQEGVDSVEPYYAEFIPQLVLTAIALPLILAYVFYLDWISGLIMLLTAPLIPLFMVLIGHLSAAVSARQWHELKRLNDHFLDVLRGMKTLRLFGRAERQTAIVGQVADAFRRTTLRVLKVSFLSALTLELSATLSTAVIAVSLGVRLLYGRLDFHEAFLVLLLSPEYYQPLRQLGARFHTATGAKSATDAIDQWLQQPTGEHRVETAAGQFEGKPATDPHMTFPPCPENQPVQTCAGGIPVELRGVRFAYHENQPVLDNLNLAIPAGQHVALTGPSGSGKTTLAALLLGFLKPQSGQVLVNGVDLQTCRDEQLSQWLAYVPQYPRLFADSLWNNLVLGQPTASEQAVKDLLDELGLSAMVDQLPQGLETAVGQGGQPLSGGQVQRIGLARALLKHAPLLILDEPTSALDPETEAYIHATLDRHLNQVTVLTIAHRLTTIQQSDRIVYLQDGKIAEQGTHLQLLAQGGLYHRLAAAMEDQP